MSALKTLSSAQPAPDHLSTRMRVLWREITNEFALDHHHLELLRLALEALDRCEEARQAIAEEGAFVHNSSGARAAHPAVAVERDSRLAAVRVLRELDLDGETVAQARPPRGRRSR